MRKIAEKNCLNEIDQNLLNTDTGRKCFPKWCEHQSNRKSLKVTGTFPSIFKVSNIFKTSIQFCFALDYSCNRRISDDVIVYILSYKHTLRGEGIVLNVYELTLKVKN